MRTGERQRLAVLPSATAKAAVQARELAQQ
jgi:hypothetical protein